MAQNINEKDRALLKAVKANNIDLVKDLLASGASPDARKSTARKTALMVAASRGYCDVMKILLEAGAETGHTEMLMNTALHFACINGVARSVELLIAAGCEINKPNAFHKTPLMVAITNNRFEVVKILLNKDPSLRVGFLYSDDSELTLACQLPDGRIADYLLDNFTPIVGIKNELQVALLRAVVQQRADVVNMLCGYGADIDYIDMFLDPPIFTAIRSKNHLVLQTLLDLGADVNKKCFGGDSPLLFAITHDNETAVKMLTKKGAIVDENAARERLEQLRFETKRRLESMIAAVEAVISETKKKNDAKEEANEEKSIEEQMEKVKVSEAENQSSEEIEEEEAEAAADEDDKKPCTTASGDEAD